MKRAPVIPLAAGLAVSTIALTVWGIAVMLSGLGNLAGPYPLGWSWATETAAVDALHGTPEAKSLARSEELSRQGLMLSPYTNNARVRLALIEAAGHGRMTPQGIDFIAQSYRLLPIDYAAAPSRITVALENWSEMPPDVQHAVRREALAFAKVNSHDVSARDVLRSIRNPAGRAIATVWLSQLDYGGADAF